jgi:hypothetical protein
MRGEFNSVWSETWREIWLPLVDHEDVPEDIFCELYRELAPVLRDLVSEDALAVPINDAIQLREAFERAIVLAGIDIALALVHDAFDASRATELRETSRRRAAVEASLTALVGDAERAAALLGRALSESARDPQKRAEAKERAIDRVINDAVSSRQAFEAAQSSDLAGERALVAFLEAAHAALDELGGDELSNRYFNLLAGFIDKFSLRYDLRRPCTLCPTLPGMFASLLRTVNGLALTDGNVAKRLKDVHEAVQDLRLGQTEGRIANCVAKQVMLLEAIGATAAGVTGTELAAICNQVRQWPHPAMKTSLLNLYGFASDFPGLRHGTPSTGMLRDIDMRDLVAVSILLAGFMPYLSDQLDAEVVYRGA